MIHRPGHSYLNDKADNNAADHKLGNRTWRDYNTSNQVRMIWDDLDRMTSYASTSAGDVYRYRAAGMRVTKVAGAGIPVVVGAPIEGTAVSELGGATATAVSGFNDSTASVNQSTWRYYYDGQMGFEDDYTRNGTGGTIVDMKRYGIGMRGMDDVVSYTKTGSGNFSQNDEGYPLYDTSGNNVAIVRKAANNWYDKLPGHLSDRTYDAWGKVDSNSPNQGYCGNLGHRADDESALVYMRARYYEPSTGRFVSEDPARSSWNWFCYGCNIPTSMSDDDGQVALPTTTAGWLKFLRDRYGDWKSAVESPSGQILAAGASACAALVLWSTRLDTASTALTIAGYSGTSFLATTLPWLPGLLICLGSVARIASVGCKFAAMLLGYTTMIAFILSWTEEAS